VASRSTVRASPQATRGRTFGSARNNGRSRSSNSTGGRLVSERGRALTSASQARPCALASSNDPKPS
jgi:hypothetical protein